MTDNSDKVFEQEAAVFKALGHPTRLRIVKALAGGEKCVCELQSLTGGSLSTVSRHLQVLRTAGVIESRREGLNIYCSLGLPCIGTMLACLESTGCGSYCYGKEKA